MSWLSKYGFPDPPTVKPDATRVAQKRSKLPPIPTIGPQSEGNIPIDSRGLLAPETPLPQSSVGPAGRGNMTYRPMERQLILKGGILNPLSPDYPIGSAIQEALKGEGPAGEALGWLDVPAAAQAGAEARQQLALGDKTGAGISLALAMTPLIGPKIRRAKKGWRLLNDFGDAIDTSAPERVIGAAHAAPGGQVWADMHHGVTAANLRRKTGVPLDQLTRGYWTSHGNFLTPEEASALVKGPGAKPLRSEDINPGRGGTPHQPTPLGNFGPNFDASRRRAKEALAAENAAREALKRGDTGPARRLIAEAAGLPAPKPDRSNPDVLKILGGLRQQGVDLPRVTKVSEEHARRMARTYESLPTNDPAAREAYDALNAEVEQQYKAITDAGYKLEFVDADPYKNSAEMMADVRDNKRLRVFKTGADQQHPYMSAEQNDRFRAVHDFLAHAGEGHQFGPIGEENAYRVHMSTLSPLARRALATETRGQNSWVNFGPNAHLPVKERPFAPQKAALWPEELLGDYADMVTPDDFGTFTPGQVVPPQRLSGDEATEIVQEHFAGKRPDMPALGKQPVRYSPTDDAELLASAAARQAQPKGLLDVQDVAPPAAAPPASALPAQTDIERPYGPRIPQSKLDEVRERSEKVFSSPLWQRWMEQGLRLPRGPLWYDTRGVRGQAIDALGDQEGADAFEELMQMMAASTAIGTPPNNLRRASWWRGLNRAGLLDPEELRSGVALPAPEGFGHFAQRLTHQPAIADIVERGSVDPIRNPKPAGFGSNLGLNWRPATLDDRISKMMLQIDPGLRFAFDVGKHASPKAWAYRPAEQGMQSAAEAAVRRGLLDVPEGLDPTAAFQAASWVGLDPSSYGGTFEDVYSNLLGKSANLWGVSPAEASRLMWQGNPFELPLNSPLLRR